MCEAARYAKFTVTYINVTARVRKQDMLLLYHHKHDFPSPHLRVPWPGKRIRMKSSSGLIAVELIMQPFEVESAWSFIKIMSRMPRVPWQGLLFVSTSNNGSSMRARRNDEPLRRVNSVDQPSHSNKRALVSGSRVTGRIAASTSLVSRLVCQMDCFWSRLHGLTC